MQTPLLLSQLYTPFWADAYPSPYNMTPSTVLANTKLVVPEDSYAFFSNYFDSGIAQTNGRYGTQQLVACAMNASCVLARIS